ncbi:MAG: purine-binding chemotaxis protein CheW [Anaerolineae bacterium]|nr:purine-binding chemotaxis protein CheW [Anaerolineae bacterium]
MPAVFVICRVGEQQYAISVADMLEVTAMVRLTPLPAAPPAVLGVVNRHGAVMPLLDLRVCLGQPAEPPDLNSLFVVVRGPEYVAGLVVDDILEVTALGGEIQHPPAQSGPYVRGMTILNEQPILILDTTALLRMFAPPDLAVEGTP